MLVRLRESLPKKKKSIKLLALDTDTRTTDPRDAARRAYIGGPLHAQKQNEESKQDRESCYSKCNALELPGIKNTGSGSGSESSDHANSISASVLKMHHGVISESEVSVIEMVKEHPEWQEAFVVFDHDQDGYLSEQEFTDAFRSLGLAQTNAQISLLLKDLASSREQHVAGVSWEEFKTIIAKETVKTESLNDSDEKFLKKLEIFQKDGLVDLSHVRHLLTGYGEKMNHEDVELLLENFSKNSLEEVSFQPDFVNVFQSRNVTRDVFVDVSEAQTVPKDL